jgi:CBS domain-containing membrane protein
VKSLRRSGFIQNSDRLRCCVAGHLVKRQRLPSYEKIESMKGKSSSYLFLDAIVFERFSSTSRHFANRRAACTRYFGSVATSLGRSPLRGQLHASMGALMGIGLTGLISARAFGTEPHLPLIVAPMGASAVLLFAAPTSPFAQPWAVIGGNTVSVLVGIAVGRFIHEPALAIGIAVGLAIVAMSGAGRLHPPGGAAALTAIIGGPSVAAAGFSFAFVPVCLNAVLLVLLGTVYHGISGLSYPHIRHVAPRGPPDRALPCLPTCIERQLPALDKALDAFGETVDISKGDLERLSTCAETLACPPLAKAFSSIDIASKDIFLIASTASVEAARTSLLDKGVARLVVVDPYGHPIGTLGWGELSRDAECVAEVMAELSLMKADASLSELVHAFTVSSISAAVIIDDDNQMLGLVTPIDLLKGMSPSLCSLQTSKQKRATYTALPDEELP